MRTPGLPKIHSTAGCSRCAAVSRRRPLSATTHAPARRPQPALRPSDGQTALDVAHDYAAAGLLPEAIEVLEAVAGPDGPDDQGDPLVAYTLGWLFARSGDPDAAMAWYERGRRLPPDGCFPARLEEIEILEAAQAANPADARAPYYLGNLLYDRRRYNDAIASWERARRLDPSFPTVHRNLGIAEANVRRRPVAARRSYLRAFAADSTDGRVLYELDQLLKRQNAPPVRRLARLQGHRDLVDARDDLGIEYATLLDQLDRPADALAYLEGRRFHPWEGGEGLALGAYLAVRVRLAREALAAGAVATALGHLEAALTPPPVARRGAPSPGARTRDPIRARSGSSRRRGRRGGARGVDACRPTARGRIRPRGGDLLPRAGAPSARS